MKITENRIKLTTFATYNYQYANTANMRKQLLSMASFALAITTLSSCLGESTSYTYYNDAAITAFKLGTLKRTMHTLKKTDGTDSTYTTTLDCSGYTFYIDQNEGRIWNADSLPVGINTSKALCTITTKNSSSAMPVKSLNSDSLSWYSSTDSLDFSSVREFRVYNSNGTACRTYTVQVNVHNEEADSCVWTQLPENSQIASFTEMKALSDS